MAKRSRSASAPPVGDIDPLDDDDVMLPVAASGRAADIREPLLRNGTSVIEYVHGPQPADRLAVTFSPYGATDIEGPGYAEVVFRRLGYDVIAVKGASTNWYQDVSLRDFEQMRAALPAYRRTVTYGSNMGGYAAMYFADAIGAFMAIAVSPQISIEASIVPFESRWRSEAAAIAFTHRPLAEVLETTQATHHVIYDPVSLDAAHVDMMCDATDRVIPIEMLHGGHPANRFLMETGIRHALLRKLLAEKTMDVRAAVRAGRSRSPTYFYTLAVRADAMRHSRWAEIAFERSIALAANPDVMIAYSRWLSAQGRTAESLTWYERAKESAPDDRQSFAFEAHLRQSAGDEAGALVALDAGIRQQPGHMELYAAERAILRRRLIEQERKLGMLEAVIAKAKAERELGRTQVPANAGAIHWLRYLAASVAIVVLVVLFARWVGLA